MLSRKDNQWLDLCVAGAEIFSTCLKKQYFCFVVNKDNLIVGQGYNGVPSGLQHCNDGGCPRAINMVPSGTPYDSGPGLCFSGHAEQNALARSDGFQLSGSTLYVNGLPCFTCAKQIASAGIRRCVFCFESDRLDWDDTSKFLKSVSIEVEVRG